MYMDSRKYLLTNNVCCLKIPSMYYRHPRGDMIEVFKYLHSTYKIESPLVRESNTRIRGHSLKLKKWYSRLDL